MVIIKNAYAAKDSIYNSSKELMSLKWSRNPAELFLSKVKDIRLRMINLSKSTVDESQFISKILDEMPNFMYQLQSKYRMKLF